MSKTPVRSKQKPVVNGKGRGKANGSLQESMVGRRGSSRVQILKLKEEEKKRKEEEDRLRMYEDQQKKREDREKKKLEKMRTLGSDFVMAERKRKLKKKLKKRKRAMKRSEDEDEDFMVKSNDKVKKVKEPEKIVKKIKKKQAWENVNKEFSKFSSGSEESGLEEEDLGDLEEMYHEIEEERDNIFKSDHEFSCESGDDDEDYVVVKHARTGAAKKQKETEKFACKKCDKNDHPEWILLCDTCEDGWHASCLRPSLMVIPEGDWFCPDCNHKKLLTSLDFKLTELDSLIKKTEAERRRKERLAFVNQSLSKSLPSSSPKKQPPKPEKVREVSSESSSSSDDSEDEPLLVRSCRTQNTVKYNTEDYDNMIKKALGEDIVRKQPLAVIPPEQISEEEDSDDEEESDKEESPGKAGTKAGQGKGKSISNGESEEEEEEESEGEAKPKPLKMNINKGLDLKKGKARKKKRNLCDMNASDESGDGDSGSDFVVTEDEKKSGSEFELEGSDDMSDESGYRGKKNKKSREPARRSNRARRKRIDQDFIDDETDNSEDERIAKKKRKGWSDSEAPSDSDSDYGRKKKKKSKVPKIRQTSFFGKTKKVKAVRRRYSDDDSDSDRPKKKKNKLPSFKVDQTNIVSNASSSRRTRGVQINYSVLQGSSEEDVAVQKSVVKTDNNESEESGSENEAPNVKRKAVKKGSCSEDEFEPDKSDDKEEEDDEEDEEEEDEKDDDDVSDEATKSSSNGRKPDISEESEAELDEDPLANSANSNDSVQKELKKDIPPLKPLSALSGPPLLSNRNSPFPKAPPPSQEDEDSEEFMSPATPSEDEDDE